MAPIQASSSASSSAKSNASFDSSGWNVNYGHQNTTSPWLWIAVAVAAFLYFRKVR